MSNSHVNCNEKIEKKLFMIFMNELNSMNSKRYGRLDDHPMRNRMNLLMLFIFETSLEFSLSRFYSWNVIDMFCDTDFKEWHNCASHSNVINFSTPFD